MPITIYPYPHNWSHSPQPRKKNNAWPFVNVAICDLYAV